MTDTKNRTETTNSRSHKMKIETIQRDDVKIMQAEMVIAIEKVMEKYGVNVKAGRATFADHHASFKFEVTVPGKAAEVGNRDGALVGAKFGIGDRFQSNGTEFEVTEFNIRRRKYPVGGQNVSTGKNYKFTVDDVNVAMGFGRSNGIPHVDVNFRDITI